MSAHVVQAGPVHISRHFGPAGNTSADRWQVTLRPGWTDNCGQRTAWASIDRAELRQLATALYEEARRLDDESSLDELKASAAMAADLIERFNAGETIYDSQLKMTAAQVHRALARLR